MTTQSIIVYRNPMEAAFWESGMAFPLMVGLVLSLAVALGLNWIFVRYNQWQYRRNRYTRGRGDRQAAAIVFGMILTMIATVWFMM